MNSFHPSPSTLMPSLLQAAPIPPSLPQTLQLPPAGLLLVHKEAGPTSHQVIDLARRALNIKKIGHCGTLDPFASGLLILLIAEATRLQHHFLTMNKTYEAEFVFGESTDTLDPTGTFTKRDPEFSLPDIESIQALIEKKFIGTISQVPPRYSAVKVNGKRAYKLSREQKTFELKPKEVTIHHFHAKKISPQSCHVTIQCSSGTYVRSLVRDLAVAMETTGMLKSLVRTQIEELKLADATPMQELTPSNHSLNQAISSLHQHIHNSHSIELDSQGLQMLKNGRLSNLLKHKKKSTAKTIASDEKKILETPYQLLFHNNVLVGIWERKRDAIIYNMAKYC